MNLKKIIAVSLLITSVTTEAQSTYVSPYEGASYTNQFSLNPYVLNGIGPYGQQIGITQQLDFLGPSIGLGYSYTNNFNDLMFGGLPNYNQYSMFSNPAALQLQFTQPFQNTLDNVMNRGPSEVNDTQTSSTSTWDYYNSLRAYNKYVEKTTYTENECSDEPTVIWKDNVCVNVTEEECNARVDRVWVDDACNNKNSLNEEECSSVSKLTWLHGSCVDKPKTSEDCLKIKDAVWSTGGICHDKTKLTQETCKTINGMDWINNACSALGNDKIKCAQSEEEARDELVAICSKISKEDCLDPRKNNGHAATWYHGSCWDVGCEKDEKKLDPFCVASKNEADKILSCSTKKGVWTEAKRDGTNWSEGLCVEPVVSSDNKIENPSKDSNSDSGTHENFSLYITGNLDFLNSDKKTDGQYPKFNFLQSCLQNLNGLQDRNLQYSSDNEQFSFRDIKKGQSGISFVENKTAFFVEEKELIKIRDDSCKDEIKKAIQIPNIEKSKLFCSVNFSIGGNAYTVKFQKGNILADSPQYLVTDSGDGIYESEYSAPEQDIKKVNYKNLYLGIENAFRNLTTTLRESCPKDPKKFSSDAYIGKLLNFSGSCDGVLTTGWRDQDIDPSLEDDLKNAIKACRARTKAKSISHEYESSNISK